MLENRFSGHADEQKEWFGIHVLLRNIKTFATVTHVLEESAARRCYSFLSRYFVMIARIGDSVFDYYIKGYSFLFNTTHFSFYKKLGLDSNPKLLVFSRLSDLKVA